MTDRYVLQMHDIKKSYYGTQVLKGVNLEIREGEILSLVGENGAGKSTLMNILFGMPQIQNTGGYSGEILFDGKKTDIKTPQDAMNQGIGMVHQEFMLLPNFTVTENIKLNREILKPGVLSRIFGKKLSKLDYPAMKKDARTALNNIGLDISEDDYVAGLPVGFMQFVEIARETDKKNMRLIVFDEPTAVLTEIESQRLLDTIKKLASMGVAVIFISHKLQEVMNISDTIVVLRDGENVKTISAKDTNVTELAECMVGHDIDSSDIAKPRDMTNQPVILNIKDFKVNMPGEQVKDLNLQVKKGEIIGIGGLAGQGKIGISNGILGLYPASGEVDYNGEKLGLNNPLDVLKHNIAFVSEDRKNVGLILSESITDNITIAALRVKGRFLKKVGFFTQKDKKEAEENARQMIKEFQIKCVSSEQKVGDLSGGNQQKVCLARAITMEPDVLFVSEPTRGIDIGAKQVILQYLVKLNREKGVTIVMTSSELNELRMVCDRIAIITDGRVEGILPPDAPGSQFGLMMSGTHVEEVGA